MHNAGIDGVAHNAMIGSVPHGRRTPNAERDEVEKAGVTARGAERARQRSPGPRPKAEPLADLQWDMQQINATVDGSYRVEQGDERVLVGIIDTGVDGTHPDIAPNFSNELSRNFTVDIPVDANGDEIDGRARTSPTSRAPTRRTSTKTATARTSPRRSARRSTGSASPVSRRT